jgi:preprotein translocase subunit YajC|tara:strand:+ start:4445 stop:4876 length:432 start_codon:yes stop_codon:yes gene_type:complete
MFIENALADTDTITIQDTKTELAAPSSIESSWTSLVPMVLIFVVFYFLLIRPQEKKRRQQAQLVSEVKKGEEILTNTGLFGKVVEINDSDNTIMVQVAKDVEIKMLKNSIANIISRNKGEDSKNPKKDTTKKDKALTTKTKKK